jgi:hypothetical protein
MALWRYSDERFLLKLLHICFWKVWEGNYNEGKRLQACVYKLQRDERRNGIIQQ